MSEYRAGGFPKKFRVESQFGICFHVCLTHVARAIVQSGLNPTLHVVVEAGHKNVGSAVTIFEGMKREWINKSGFPLLGDITIRNKAECPELMASDFLAHSYAALYRKKPLGENDGRPRAADTDFRGLRYVGLTEGALAQAKAEFAKRQEEQIAKWRAKRAEASFSLSSNSEAGQPHRQASKRQPSS